MNDRQPRALGIIRVSQVGDRDAERFASPDEQRLRIAELCTREGLELTQMFPEMDVSGGATLSRRPGLSRAVAAVEAGQADVVVVAYFDRLVRSLPVQAEVVGRIERAGGRVLAADIGQIHQNNGSASQWLSSTLLGAVAEYQRRSTAERTLGAQRRAVEEGRPPFQMIPGLNRVGGHVELDPNLAPAIAEAVRMRARGETIETIRAYLADHGLRRSYHGVITLLRSRLLVGQIVFGQNRPAADRIIGTVPAIIDLQTWEQAQMVSSPRGRKAKSDRLLARLGVLRCGSCGARMSVGTQTQNGRSYPFYRCPATGDCTARVTISGHAAEKVVSDAVRAALDGTVGLRAAREDVRRAVVTLRRAQAALDTATRMMLGAGLETEAAAIARLQELREARDAARERVDRLGGGDDEILLLAKDWDALSMDDRRRCIRATIDRAIVGPTGKGVKPEDRITVVYHDGRAWLTGRTPPLPSELA